MDMLNLIEEPIKKTMKKNENLAEMEKQIKIDRISNLPWDVLDTILVRLPLRDAARTSILSSKWRYKWTNLSQFILDDKCIHNFISDKASRWIEIRKIIDQVQSNHNGPIEKFKLAAYCCPNYSDLDQWIRFLIEKGIKELIIQEFSVIKHFKLPDSVFCGPKLSHLELYGCILRLPSSFKGFDCLKILQLSHVLIISDALEHLIRNCPVLEKLTLLNLQNLAYIRIYNPNLKYVKIDSAFEDICLEHSLLLASVDIRMLPTTLQHPDQGKVCTLIRVFGSLRGINRLSLSNQFLEFLANKDVPEKLPTPFNSLLALELKEIRFASLKGIAASISILRSSPNLKDLLVTVDPCDEISKPVMDLVTAQLQSDFYFDQLKVVKIRGIIGTRIEWEFLRLILAHSPVLESMTIVKFRGERISESFLQEVERASNHVKFISLAL
ncbi:F-BOX PROTEIN-LIKE [Salix koriyanagi]|uniref:F-BOX PROTEIN-LIKE n=1 Tax=Salix koriyanagi TaxID=2511006 RepID=A0A9Q1A018_9ROSI|nr:F-BOX PROTEIN-LIKE [Salix koriyanagi]KAJ6752965.1 F-BOX PROTEIN-LIKE [Salix koriyanagi]KAJ6752966.1 F-BOX PROTEIN-LIKE [Salix koriyanagi]